jgi:hypothetical protein
MANFNKHVPENVPGEFFVDSTCIDCDTCRGRVADLHFPPLCAMLLTVSEGERHGTHSRALSSLS